MEYFKMYLTSKYSSHDFSCLFKKNIHWTWKYVYKLEVGKKILAEPAEICDEKTINTKFTLTSGVFKIILTTDKRLYGEVRDLGIYVLIDTHLEAIYEEDDTIKYDGYTSTSMKKHVSVSLHQHKYKCKYCDGCDCVVFTVCNHRHKDTWKTHNCHFYNHTHKSVYVTDYGNARVAKIS
jgi:hypothetical protein